MILKQFFLKKLTIFSLWAPLCLTNPDNFHSPLDRPMTPLPHHLSALLCCSAPYFSSSPQSSHLFPPIFNPYASKPTFDSCSGRLRSFRTSSSLLVLYSVMYVPHLLSFCTASLLIIRLLGMMFCLGSFL